MMIVAPASRNARCPCGSGRRYKDCHGALGAAAPAVDADADADLATRVSALLATGRVDEASALLDRDERLQDDPALALLAARVAFARGERAGTIDRCRALVATDAAHVAAWNLLGEALNADDPEGALAAWRAAAAAAPGDGEAHFHIGNALREGGAAAGAIVEYEAALAATPDHPAVLNNLGLAREATGDRDGAAAVYRRVLERDPDQTDALANLANVLFAQGDFAATEQLYVRLFPLRPDLPAYVLVQRGNALQSLWRPAEAEAHFRKALAAHPGDLALLIKIAEVCIEQDAFAAAQPVLAEIVAQAPDDAWGRAMHALAKLHLCDWTGLEPEYAWLRDFFARHPDDSRTPPSPLSIMSMPFGAEEQRAAARGWAKGYAAPVAAPPVFAIAANEKLRIGFLSSDLRDHALTHLALEFWELLRGGRLETFAYNLLPDATGPLGARVRSAFDHYVNAAHESAEATTARIRADGIAVLFDCNGHSAHARTEVLARRAAPLQVNFLGCPSTSGAPWWDYIFADGFALPPEHERWFDERPLRMPHTMFPCDTTRVPAGPPPLRAAYGLPEDAFVFCCFNANYKLLPDVFAIWMRVMAEVDDSVLWLLATQPEARDNLAREAQHHGIGPRRLLFASMVAPADNLARHRVADLLLDTFPYGGGASAGNALLAGLPVLTCAGDTLTSRLAGSQLHAAGLPELVTHNPAAYEAMALRLARDRGLLRELRVRLAANRGTAPLFDMHRYSRDFEDVVLRAWTDHLARPTAAAAAPA